MAFNARSALVTGGGRGLGRSIADRLAADGWAVGLLARTRAEVESSAAEIRDQGGEARGFVADVLDPVSLEHGFRRFLDWSGRLDSLVCAAGRLRAIGPLEVIDPVAWGLDLSTSLLGSHSSIRLAIPILRKSPSPSITLLVGPGHNGELAYASGYGIAQTALVRLAESLARELMDDRIGVYALNPGLVATNLVGHLLESPEGRRWLPRFTEAFAEGKEVGPEVVATMAAWLLDERPMTLSGRVIAAPITPEILQTRLDRIETDDLNRLRLR